MCGNPITQIKGRPALMHEDCRKEERRAYWRRRRAEAAVERLDDARARALERVRKDYERRLEWAVGTARRAQAMHDSPLWRLLTREKEQRRIREMLLWVARQRPAEGATLYEIDALRMHQGVAKQLLNALDQSTD